MCLAACSDSGGAERVLAAQGFDQIETTGYRWLGCGKEDFYQTGFRACRAGKCITGVVCGGQLKGNTVRFD